MPRKKKSACRYCRKEIPESALFCPWCGEKQVGPKKHEKKYPQPEILSDGSYVGRLMIDGQRETVKAASEAEYKAKIDALRTGVVERQKAPDKRLVSECVWAYIRAREGIASPSTIDGYERKARNNFQGLMNMRVRDLNLDVIQAAVNEEKKRYSGKTIKEALSLIRSATKIKIDPDQLVTPSPKPKKKPPVYSTDDLRKLVLALAEIGGQIECAGLLAAWMSLRRSEIIGLRWTDLEEGNIVIRTARVYDKTHKLVEKDGKTETSARRIPCDPYVMARLQALPRGSEYVFTVSTSGLWEGITKACKIAGIEHGYLHGLRHTNASVMEMLGVPAVYANKRGGWASDHVRRKVYTDPMAEGDMAAAVLVDNFYNGLLEYGPPLPPGFIRRG